MPKDKWKEIPLQQVLKSQPTAAAAQHHAMGSMELKVEGCANKMVTLSLPDKTRETVKVESIKLSDPVLGLQKDAVFSVTVDRKNFTLRSFPFPPPGGTLEPDIDRNPYNFVAFAGKAPWLDGHPEAQEKHPGHECWLRTLKHGYIDLDITTSTPIFIPEWVKRDTSVAKVRNFYTMKRWIGEERVDHYAIPGSSFKGALRCMVEALANDRFGAMDDDEYYKMPIPYRRRAFNDRKKKTPEYHVGLATWNGTDWKVQPVDYKKINGVSTACQLLAQPARHSRYSEDLVGATNYTIPETVVVKYRDNLKHRHYAKHMEKCAGKYQPALDKEQLQTYLKALDLSTASGARNLIFFTLTSGPNGTLEVDSFGKNVNYLWPSSRSIEGLAGPWFPPITQDKPAPMGLKHPLGLAEQMFGFVSDHDETKSSHPFRGKLRFEPLWAPKVGSIIPLGGEKGIRLAPLTAPQSRAKSRPLYLCGRVKNFQLHSGSYSDHDPELRGRKFYWKQRNYEQPEDKNNLWEFHKSENQSLYAEKQLPAPIRPLPAGTPFKTRIHFDNLSEPELGALLFALLGNDPRPAGDDKPHSLKSGNHRIHLGKGKPRGLGVCSVEASVTWFNPTKEYASLSPEPPARISAKREGLIALSAAFSKWCEEKAGPGSVFKDMAHILDFIKLHTWPESPSVRYYPVQFAQYSWVPKENENPGDPVLADRPLAMRPARELTP